MKDGGSVASLPPFQPPYELSGGSVAIVGLWKRKIPAAPPDGYRFVSLFGRPLAVVVANHYEKPPEELPIRYHELIAAALVRRGVELAALPFDMVLDQELPVDLGREHYSLPKRLDPSMHFEIDASRLVASANGLEVDAHAYGAVVDALAWPMRVAFALGVRLLTASIDVLGVAEPSHVRARIALRPEGIGDAFRVASCAADGIDLQPLWCQSWRWSTTWLGPPRALGGDAHSGK